MKPVELYAHVLNCLTDTLGIVVRESELREISGNTEPPFNYVGKILYYGNTPPLVLADSLIKGLEGVIKINSGSGLRLTRFSTKNGGGEIVDIEMIN